MKVFSEIDPHLGTEVFSHLKCKQFEKLTIALDELKRRNISMEATNVILGATLFQFAQD
ncbi:hypothetical protein [Paraburkholderia hospita]|uniref:hypothetical protein n=1 Tax=Paraburkholderia hospita TaxID=169430 RepID=UPI001404D0BD|nr:hypothetical protein [Paraburkholderia hospita]